MLRGEFTVYVGTFQKPLNCFNINAHIALTRLNEQKDIEHKRAKTKINNIN